MKPEKISDRHIRPIDGLKNIGKPRGMTIRIIANEAVRNPAGQHLIVCLTNLLARMTEIVVAIDFALPSVAVTVALPHVATATSLPDALLSLVRWAVGNEVKLSVNDPEFNADMHLSIGIDLALPEESSNLYAIADGWKLWVGTKPHIPQHLSRPMSENPLGPFLAASLLAGEVFKRAFDIARGKWLNNFCYSLWSGIEGSWGDLADGPPLSNTFLPPFYLVGAGAVGQGLVNVIGAANFSETYVITIDDDHHDRSNFNRCFLAGIEDEKRPKVEAVSRFRGTARMAGYEFQGTLNDYIRSEKPGLLRGVANLERQDKFDCIASCVDKGTSRQDIQGLWPRIIVGGSTVRLTAKAIVYDLSEGTCCLGCHNPPEQDGDQLRRIEQFVRSMSSDERRLYISSKVKNEEAVLNYLTSSEKCGTVGEAEFRAFAIQQTREFSVSFISMAAAVLQASHLFGRLVFKNDHSKSLGHMTSIAFLNSSISHNDLSIDAKCERCQGKPAIAFTARSPMSNHLNI